MSNYENDIIRIKSGETRFFAAIVTDFQEIALTSAYAWLGDIELARDAVQEAFLDAYLKLDQLQNPAAFPGWFRRIVFKHCDRLSRLKSPVLVEIDEAITEISSEIPLLNQLISNESDQEIRRLVEKLPQEQRLIVALHYFSDVTGQQIADFLELPLSTIKKRLRVARATLKNTERRSIPVMTKDSKSVLSESLPDEVAMFIAIRHGDYDAVKQLLLKSPELVDVEQNWHRDLVYGGILPFATRATALISTIEQDDLVMLNLLLNNGADPDGICGCETGESPLWAAALLNREEHAGVLLAAGADPNVISASGNTPLHIAAMRGHIGIVKLLLAHGADADIRERDSAAVWPLTSGATKEVGWRPLDWAKHNGHRRIAGLLHGEVELTGSQPATIIDQPLLHTGIKAIDFFVPLEKGSLIRLPFKAGVGMMVLLGELNEIFLSHSKGAVIWTGFTQPPFDIADLETEFSEFGLSHRVTTSLVSYRESLDRQREGFLEGIGLANAMREEGKEVLAVIQSAQGFETDIEQALYRLAGDSKAGSITSIVLTPFSDGQQTPVASQSWKALCPPYRSQITLDRTRSIKNLYPGIDPALSMSKADGNQLGEAHIRMANKVREILAWYRTRDPEFDWVYQQTGDARTMQARKLILYFTQPFKISEPFRGTPGVSVNRERLLEEVGQILGETTW